MSYVTLADLAAARPEVVTGSLIAAGQGRQTCTNELTLTAPRQACLAALGITSVEALLDELTSEGGAARLRRFLRLSDTAIGRLRQEARALADPGFVALLKQPRIRRGHGLWMTRQEAQSLMSRASKPYCET